MSAELLRRTSTKYNVGSDFQRDLILIINDRIHGTLF